MNIYLAIAFDSPVLLVWAACIGFNIAMVVTFVLKKTQGKFLAKLIESGANSEETAASLGDLGYEWRNLNGKGKANSLLQFFLRDEGSFRRIVKVCGGKLPTVTSEKGKEVADFGNAKFYIEEKDLDKVNSFKKGVLKWYFLPLFAILSVLIAWGIIMVLPFVVW